MNIPHTRLSVDINRRNHLTVDLIGHVNDKNTRYLDLQLTANNEVIELEQGCTATVTYTSDNVLIDQDVECDVNGNVIEIGFDSEKVEHARSGILAIQPKITDTNDNVLTLQIPIYVRVSADIAQSSQIDDDSRGSYAEVVREIAAARKGYESIGERMDNIASDESEEVYIGDTEPIAQNYKLWVDTSAPVPQPPEPVTNLSGTTTSNSATLTWTASSGATAYKIYNGNSLIDTASSTTCTISSLTASTEYTFGVVASNENGDATKVTVTVTTQESGGQLPDEYQEVDYVKTPATTYSAINTGLLTNGISKIMMGLETDYSDYIDIINSAQTYNTGANTDYAMNPNISTHPNINNGASKSYLVGKGYSSYSVVADPVEYPGTTQKVEFVFDVATDYSFYYSFGDSALPGWNTAERTIYYMKFYNSSDELVADFIPCYRKSDNKVGMYDVVRRQFFTPLFSNWTKGSDV